MISTFLNGFRISEYPILNVTLNICFLLLAVSLICGVYRIIKGPTIADRIISGDSITCYVMILVVLYGIQQQTTLFMPAVLVTAIMGFLGMIGMSKYIAAGNIIYPLYVPAQPEPHEPQEETKCESK
jgi:multicomponent K+:H+ antiporter subunit F